MSENEVSVKDRLEAINSQFNELISLASNDQPDKAIVKNKYGVLKVKLRAGRDKSNLVKTQSLASKDELHFYYPAVSKAANALFVAIGGNINDRFVESLHDAQGQIEYYLNQL